MAAASALGVHLADQALAVLARATHPMTTREVALAADLKRDSDSTTRIRLVLGRLERAGQVVASRSHGMEILWQVASGACTLTVDLMPPLNVINQKERNA